MALKKERILSALSGLSSDASERVLGAIIRSDFRGQLGAALAVDADALLPLAAAFSQAPISGFNVGAVAVGQSGHFYLGTNLEFQGVSLNATLHAEQSAVANAWMHGESALTAIHITEAPCGHCRQFLRELSNAGSLNVHIKGQPFTLDGLLPNAFGEPPAQGHGLLDKPPANLESAKPENALLRLQAIEAAGKSYTPYSHSPEGFVIECMNGQTFTGRAAESVAFNPSASSALVALNQRNFSTSRDVAIASCTLAKLATTLNNPLPATLALLKPLTDAAIDVVQMESQ